MSEQVYKKNITAFSCKQKVFLYACCHSLGITFNTSKRRSWTWRRSRTSTWHGISVCEWVSGWVNMGGVCLCAAIFKLVRQTTQVTFAVSSGSGGGSSGGNWQPTVQGDRSRRETLLPQYNHATEHASVPLPPPSTPFPCHEHAACKNGMHPPLPFALFKALAVVQPRTESIIFIASCLSFMVWRNVGLWSMCLCWRLSGLVGGVEWRRGGGKRWGRSLVFGQEITGR